MRTLLLLVVVAACSTATPAVPRRTGAAPSARAEPTLPAELAGGRIAAVGEGALVIDDDSGMLIALDSDQRATSTVEIGRGAGLLVYDRMRERVYVADRRGDRVVVVDASSGAAIVTAWPTPVEPFGVALTPDRATVLVTAARDQVLVALDADTGSERWRVPVSREPRTIAVSPDGRRALVSSQGEGVIDVVELAGDHRVTQLAFELDCVRCARGHAFARGSGSVMFLDSQRAVASFQRAVPEALGAARPTVYGAGVAAPVTQHMAFLGFVDDLDAPVGQTVAQIVENQPRPIAWDRARDALFVAGHGSDTLLSLRGLTRQSSEGIEDAAKNFVLRASERCGPDGLAITTRGSLLVWCAFSRSVLRLDDGVDLVEGPALVASSLTPAQHAGRLLFHVTDSSINADRAIACATCHPEGRTDGVSWKVSQQLLQTPVLAGRLAATAPYKWDGSDATLHASFARTVARLGGHGLGEGQRDALAAYLMALPRPRTPTLDAAAVARGKAVFDATGCRDCHSGAAYTDGERHAFESTLPDADTPSLVGLAASVPYYHDGSAPTLDALVRGGGSVHGMFDPSLLTGAQQKDLVAFLRSL